MLWRAWTSLLLLMVLGRLLRLSRFAIRQSGFVFLVGQVVPADPGKAHLIDGAANSGAYPVLWIRVELVAGRVVEPGDDVEQRTCRHDWRHFVLVVVNRVPVVVPGRTRHDFGFHRLTG